MTVTIYYLEMLSEHDILSKPQPDGLVINEADVKSSCLNRDLYQLVGENWSWTDRLKWSDDDWENYAQSDALRTWVAYYKGEVAGYYELQKQAAHTIEIALFGLAPSFIGQGLGGYLLTHALYSAWSWGNVNRVWVHTCTLDHEGALNNYQSRGFRLYKTEQES